jgi:hypothetical protein
MVLDVDVFSASVKKVVFGDPDGALIIVEERSGTRKR